MGAIHGEEVGAFENAPVVIAYLTIASFLFAYSRFAMPASTAVSATTRGKTAVPISAIAHGDPSTEGGVLEAR